MLIPGRPATGATKELGMPQMYVLGVEVFYRDEGVGPTVVLGHSSTASSGQWRALFARLQNRYRLIAPDHLGYGRTATYEGDSSLVEYELAIIDGLLQGVSDRVHLVGHSYGAVGLSWREQPCEHPAVYKA
jgi:pimeloyl-ACP methyl ester carboxylesterase